MRSLLSVALLGSLVASLAAEPAASADPEQVRLWHVPVHHMSARHAAAILHELLPDASAIADASDQTLVVVASERTYERILEVLRPEAPSSDPASLVYVVPLRHAVAGRLAETLNAMLGERARITADDATNALVVVTTAEALASVRGIAEQLDVAPRILLELALVDVPGIEGLSLARALGNEERRALVASGRAFSRPMLFVDADASSTLRVDPAPGGETTTLSLTAHRGPAGTLRLDVSMARGAASSRTTLVVRDQQTVAFAGLTHTHVVVEPGGWFRDDVARPERRTTMVVLTAHLVSDERDLHELLQARTIERQAMLDHELLFGEVDRPPLRVDRPVHGLVEAVRLEQRRAPR